MVASMDGLKVLEVVKKINPWFKTGSVPAPLLETFRRREFSFLERDLSKLDMATLIIGARRVGKSVLMYQLIDKLLKSGIEGKRILFIQGDNPLLNEYATTNLIRSILDLYQKHIIDQSLESLTEIIYVFIDEAQNLSHWEAELKSIIDQKLKIKFVITGSSSFELRRGAQNPLTGRVSIQSIFPLSFSDYARYQLPESDQAGFMEQVREMSADFQIALRDGNLPKIYEIVCVASTLVTPYKLRESFDSYLFYGGFPWVVANKANNDHTRYLRDLLTTTISKDIMTQVEIREPQSFERLMVNLCFMAGQSIKYKSLAETLGIDERSVTKYIDYYVESHWAFISSPYVFHTKPDSVKTEKKVYVIDSGVINTLSFKDEHEFKTDKTHQGHVIENVLHNHLLAYRQLIVGSFQNSVPFWIESSTGKEIDFIYEITGGVVPIEVKQKVSYDGSDLSTLQQFLIKRSSTKLAILTTQDLIKVEEKIALIPNLLLLLLF